VAVVTAKSTTRRRRSSSAVTIRTVAEKAGVSMMTVSNVINGTGQVSEKTRATVRQAIRGTGYIPNDEARRLATGGSKRIALIYTGNQVPFLGEVLFSAYNATASFGAQLVLRASSSFTRAALEKLTLGVARNGILGLLLLPPCAELLTGRPVLSEINVATIATAAPMVDMHTVRIDNRTATATLTEHLIRLGHRRIGFITGAVRHSDSKERQIGYEQAMQHANLTVLPELIAEGEFTFESGRRAAAQLLDLPIRPTAIVASNDEMAAGTLWMAQQRGLKLPDDLSVTGFDDTPTALKTWPPLTCIRQPLAAMVERTIALLMDDARDTKTNTPSDVVLDHVFVERASTAPVQVPPPRKKK
jgi:LacI family transcriptional regulator